MNVRKADINSDISIGINHKKTIEMFTRISHED